MISTELTNNDGTGSTNAKIMRRWTAVKTVAALVVVCEILLGCAGAVFAMMESFRIAADGSQSVPVDSLAASIGSSLRFGMSLTPIVICSAILWFVARARLRTLSRTQSFFGQSAG